MWVLRKDKKFVSQHDTESEALQNLQRIQGMSFDYAFKHGGYSLTQEAVVAICLLCESAHPKELICQTI